MNNITTFESFKQMTNNAPIYKFYGTAVFAPPDSISVNKIIFLLYLIPICNRITRKFFKRLRLRLRFHF